MSTKPPGTPKVAPALHPGVPLPAPAIGPLAPTPVAAARAPAPALEQEAPVEPPPKAASAGILTLQPRRFHPIVWASALFLVFLLGLWMFLR